MLQGVESEPMPRMGADMAECAVGLGRSAAREMIGIDSSQGPNAEPSSGEDAFAKLLAAEKQFGAEVAAGSHDVSDLMKQFESASARSPSNNESTINKQREDKPRVNFPKKAAATATAQKPKIPVIKPDASKEAATEHVPVSVEVKLPVTPKIKEVNLKPEIREPVANLVKVEARTVKLPVQRPEPEIPQTHQLLRPIEVPIRSELTPPSRVETAVFTPEQNIVTQFHETKPVEIIRAVNLGTITEGISMSDSLELADEVPTEQSFETAPIQPEIPLSQDKVDFAEPDREELSIDLADDSELDGVFELQPLPDTTLEVGYQAEVDELWSEIEGLLEDDGPQDVSEGIENVEITEPLPIDDKATEYVGAESEFAHEHSEQDEPKELTPFEGLLLTQLATAETAVDSADSVGEQAIWPKLAEIVIAPDTNKPVAETLARAVVTLSEMSPEAIGNDQVAAQINDKILAFAQVWEKQRLPRRNSDMPERLSPEVVSAFVDILKALGYENPVDAVRGVLRDHGLAYLLSMMEYLGKMGNVDNRQELLVSLHAQKQQHQVAFTKRVGRSMVAFIMSLSFHGDEELPAAA